MLSLLLTLFISLFSCGAAIHPIMDNENNVKNAAQIGTSENHIFLGHSDIKFGNLLNYCVVKYSEDFHYNSGTYAYVDTSSNVLLLDNITINKHTYPALNDNPSYDITRIIFQKNSPNNNISSYNFIVYFYDEDLQKNCTYRIDYRCFIDETYFGSSLDGYICNGNSYVYNDDDQSVVSYDIRNYYFTLYYPNEHPNGLFYNAVYLPREYGDYTSGYNAGYNVGKTEGINEGYDNGYQEGYVVGYDTAGEYDSVAFTIFEGIFDVGLLPVNVFMTIFNFEVFGVNIAGIISGLLTLAVVVIILRFLLGGGSKDDK